MKLKLGELRPIIEALPKVIEEKLPVKTSYWLARALVDITKEFQVFEETRKKLIEDKYGKKDKKGELVTKDGVYVMADQEGFEKEFMELAKQEIEIKYEPRPIDDFIIKDSDGKELNTLKGMDLLGLGRLIKEE